MDTKQAPPPTPPQPEKQDAGPFAGLFMKGSQDVYMEEEPGLTSTNALIFDARAAFLTKRHQACYKALDTTTEESTRPTYTIVDDAGVKKHTVTHHPVTAIRILRTTGDLINHVDLAIDNPTNTPLNDLISTIQIEFGGQRFDQWAIPDLEGQVAATCALLDRRRRITHTNGTTFVPLVLAPLHKTNLSFPSAAYHDLVVVIYFHPAVPEDIKKSARLYGSTYYLEPLRAKTLRDNIHHQMTFQSQFTGAETLNPGTNTFRLNFNHPIYAIYFWGFDPRHITRVVVDLDGHTFYDGPIAPLEHIKATLAPTLSPLAVFFTQDPIGTRTLSSINFSRVDNPKITIETSQESPTPFYLVGVNMQPYTYQSGMVGLRFSK